MSQALPTIRTTPASYAAASALVREDVDACLALCAKWFGIEPNPKEIFFACYRAHEGTPGIAVEHAAQSWDPGEPPPDYVVITMMRIRKAQDSL